MKTVAQKKSVENYKRRNNITSFNSISQRTFSSSFPNNNLLIQPKPICPCGGGCPECQAEQLGQEHDGLQTKHVKTSDTGQIAALSILREGLHSSGKPLDPATRGFMGPRFGRDFSHVRVHTDGRAAQAAREIRARAFAFDRNVVFAQGQYASGEQNGLRLLTHELSHIVQQGSARPLSGRSNGFPMSSVLANEGVIQRSVVVDSSNFTGNKAAKELANFKKLIIDELEPITGLSLSFVNDELDIDPKGKAKGKGSAKAAQILQLGVKAKRKIRVVRGAGSGGSHTPQGAIELGTKSPGVVLKGFGPGIILLHELSHEFARTLKASDYDKRVAAAEKRVKSGKASFREQAFFMWARPKQIQADENIPTEAINVVRSELGLGIQRTGYWIPLQFPHRPKEKDPKKRVTDYTQFKINRSPPAFLYLHPTTFEVFFSTVDFYKRPFEADGFPPIPKSSEMKKVTQVSKVFKKLRKYFR